MITLSSHALLQMINDWNSAKSKAMQVEEVNKKEGEKLKKQLSEVC